MMSFVQGTRRHLAGVPAASKKGIGSYARGFCIGLLACLVGLSARADGPQSVRSSNIFENGLSKEDFPRWQQIAADTYIFEGVHAGDPTGAVFTTVSLVVVTEEGVLVADGQGSEADTRALIDRIKGVTAQPIKYVVVGSDHGDHTGGNAAFVAVYPDVVFVSSPVSQKNLANKPNPPTKLVADRETIRLGRTEIEVLNLGRAHTGGDLVVHLPASKILFMSEVYFRGLFPAMRTAYPSEWVATIDKALAMDVDLYVPGHGFTDDGPTMRRDLVEFKRAIEYVIGEAKRLHAAGLPCESARNCKAAKQVNWGPYAKWPASGSQGPVALATVYEEIRGRVP